MFEYARFYNSKACKPNPLDVELAANRIEPITSSNLVQSLQGGHVGTAVRRYWLLLIPLVLGAIISAQFLAEIDFRTGDLRALEGVGGPFDAAVCLYDSFNYLLTPVDVDAALLAVCRILDPSSLFIFDVCTERNSLVHFSNVQDAEEGPGFVYTRHSYYDKRRQLQFNSFDICLGKEGDHVRETHSQRIYPHCDLLARIEASPFELLGTYDGFTFNRGSDESDRVHFVLRSPARQSA